MSVVTRISTIDLLLMMLPLPFPAFATQPMWIGLRMYSNYEGSCNSPADCSGKYLWHHEPGWEEDWPDDIWYRFMDEGYVDVGMNIDDDDGHCVVMHAADGTNENQLESQSCNSHVTGFVCTVSCDGKN